MSDQPSKHTAFIDRQEELQSLYRRVSGTGSVAGGSVVLAGDRGVGKTALLRQLAAHLFWKQERLVPFFYAINAGVLDVADFARDYLAAFLRHRIAFEHRDQALLSREGTSLRELAEQAGDEGSTWVGDLVERVQRCADDPVALLKTVLQAPALSATETGKPVVIMLDDFPLLAQLRRGKGEDPSLVSLFHGPIAAVKTVYILAGIPAALRELPLPALAEVPLRPLSPVDAEQLARQHLPARGSALGSMPRSLAAHLGGNPLYISRVVNALQPGTGSGDEVWWAAYVYEVASGGLYRSTASMLAGLFPALDERRSALEAAYHLCKTGGGALAARSSNAYVAGKLRVEALRTLVRSGLVTGGFGAHRAPEDAVLRDIITFLFEREIAGRPLDDVVRGALDSRRADQQAGQVWDLTVPLAPQAELVVVKSLEQIGRNLNISEETIGQLQMAVIEACINAIEHTRGGDRRMYVTIRALPERMEVIIESPGQEFVQAETGEPFRGIGIQEGPPRGHGVRMMKQFADEVKFEKGSRGTKVILGKYLVRQPSAEREGAPHRE